MPDINFKLLHIFIAIADNKSFRQASEKLNRSQSAVSMQIKQLEDQIGAALFHRTTRRVELTAEGLKLLTFARRALGEWENGLREIREAVDIQRGTLTFACIPTIAATILPRALRAFQANYPGISIRLRELAAADLLECIRHREVDFGIGVEMERSTEFRFDGLFDDPIYAIAMGGFRFRRRTSVDLADLCTYPVLLNSKSAALRIMLDRALAVRDLRMDIKFEVVHTHTLIALAEAGMGVGILPKIALPMPLKKDLRAAPIANPALIRTVSIVALNGQSLSPAGRTLTDAIRKCLKRQA
jgi:DNA-binding transcriptional LysR family regulator